MKLKPRDYIVEKIDKVKSRVGKTLNGSIRLRDLVRQVRAARTAAEERAVIEKESAAIRNSFRDSNSPYKYRNIAKLLYIHMLGYPAGFGEIECVKLIPRPRFTDKRIGYLGAMLLLDEFSELHLLVINSLKIDLNASNQFVVALALSTLGSICSNEMCRDLASEVENNIKLSNTFLKKKAILCAYRIVKKVPELADVFVSCTSSLLNEKHNGVLASSMTLITELCERNFDVLNSFKKLVPNIVRILKNLLTNGLSPEHDVNGITDPFLQVKIIRLLRVLGKDDFSTTEEMSDVLTQIATQTDTSKQVGNAVLYEAVLTIMEIKSDSSLRAVAVNILGRFLLNYDKNIRYISLNTLLKIVSIDINAVQQHQAIIVECLKDSDASIRECAIELCFTLINKTNIVSITKNILIFLETAEPEFRSDCALKMYAATARYSPNHEWHLDTMITVLNLAGNFVPEEVVTCMIQLISSNSDLQQYAMTQLFRAAQIASLNAQPMLQVAFWTIGEFGHLLFKPMNGGMTSIEENDVVNIFENVIISTLASIRTKCYAVTALAKLAARFTSSTNRIKTLIATNHTHLNLELQQRSVELGRLLEQEELKKLLLERTPVVTRNSLTATSALNENSLLDDTPVAQTNVDLLKNLMSIETCVTTQVMTANNDLFGILGNIENDKSILRPQMNTWKLINEFDSFTLGNAVQSSEQNYSDPFSEQ